MVYGIGLGLRFLLEMCGLAALAYGGFSTGNSYVWKLLLGMGSPLLMAAIWGMFISPKAAIPVKGMVKWLLELLVFGLCTCALLAAGKPLLSIVFAMLVMIDWLILYVSRPAA
ncbi:YrdB family protein [Bacillus sp. 1P06AnD]|uniref:YrdB family protein n=1 Tax=Bacillus sp. 1P06AnD TaxID=3132208 RepID=UPI0039A300D0